MAAQELVKLVVDLESSLRESASLLRMLMDGVASLGESDIRKNVHDALGKAALLLKDDSLKPRDG